MAEDTLKIKQSREIQIRKKLRKVIELTASVEKDGAVWGFDTEIGNIEVLIDKAVKILNE